jgi:hypothetical protein
MNDFLLVIAPFMMMTVTVLAGPPVDAVVKFPTFSDSQAEYMKSVAPFLAKHCVACHGPLKAESDLDLTRLEADMKSTTSGARWAMVVEKLSTGAMPPEGRARPAEREVLAVVNWAHREAKRAGRPFTRRLISNHGNAVPHQVLFDPGNVPPFDAAPRIRPLSPEIYTALINELAKDKRNLGQPFSPQRSFAFKDMGSAKIDEPVASQLLQNVLAIVEAQTAYTIEGGRVKGLGTTPKEFLALFDAKNPPSDTQIEAAIARQFETILRRPPTADEKQRFVALAKKNIAQAGPIIGSRYTLAAVLLLPEAVFRMEVGSGKPDSKGRVRLAPREIAFALSYALTDKRPDAELLKAAATGELDTDRGVENQVRRLLDDPKIDKPRILRFFREYFGYDKATEVFKENLKEFGYDPHVLVADTDALILHILRRDTNVLKELLTTNEGYVNVRMDPKNPDEVKEYHSKNNRKTHLNYSLPADWQWTSQQPITFPQGHRAGILTQPSWLIAHSTSFENHVIHRGKWIREHLLGDVVPDVPITVDAQLPHAPHLTLRERMAVTHQEYCWKCHRLMNDLGYPFEQYDHYGRYRTTESVLDPEATAKHVDKKGKSLGPVMREAPLHVNGLIAHVGDPAVDGPVTNVHDYMQRLANSRRVEQVFIRHAFRYWLGRNELPGDAATLQAAHQAYRDNNGSMKAVIRSLLTSESFLYRMPLPPESSK